MFKPLSSVSERSYLYVDRPMPWGEAIDFCKREGASLSVPNQEIVGSFLHACLPGNSTELWTNTYSVATPYLSIYGTFYEKFTTSNSCTLS
jgi:hypothetical protein